MHSRRLSGRAAVSLLVAMLAVSVWGAVSWAQSTDPSVDDVTSGVFDDHDVADAVAAAEERQEQLEAPAAVAERAESRDEFADLSPVEAKDLAREVFPSELTAALEPGPELEEGEHVKQYLADDRWAKVDHSDGEPATFVRSDVPMRAQDESGDPAPVDLDLEATQEGFAPRNPLVGVRVAEDAGNGVTLERSGVTLAPVGPGTAEAEAQVVAGKRVFWADVAADTDYFVTATPGGAESFVQVRSDQAPEQFSLRIGVPEDARLRDAGPGKGVEIVRGEDQHERVVARVGAPSAFDADGQPVEVSYELVDDQMVLSFPHRGADVHYPLLVDPTFLEDYGIEEGFLDLDWQYFQGGPAGGTLNWDVDFDGLYLSRRVPRGHRGASTRGIGRLRATRSCTQRISVG
jgi:hypothetical protein